MSIAIQCRACKTKLNAPESAAGKRVKCPKCAAMMTVPKPDEGFDVVDDNDFDVVDETPAPKKRPPLDDAPVKKKRPPIDDEEDDRPVKKKRYDDEDDDEDDDDRQKKRKKGKKKPAAKSNLPLIIGGVAALVLVLGVGGFFLFGKKDKKGSSGSTPEEKDKDGWVKFSPSDSTFNVLLPSSPETGSFRGLMTDLGVSGPEADMAASMIAQQNLEISIWTAKAGSRSYNISRTKLPNLPPDPQAAEEMITNASASQFQTFGQSMGNAKLNIAGKHAKFIYFKLKNGKWLARTTVIRGQYAYDLGVLDETKFDFTDEFFKKYIDSFAASDNGASAAPTGGPGERARR